MVSVPATVVSVGLTLGGTIEDFDETAQTALATSLKDTLGCFEPACFLRLVVSAGSVSVQAQLTIPTAAPISSAADISTSNASASASASDPAAAAAAAAADAAAAAAADAVAATIKQAAEALAAKPAAEISSTLAARGAAVTVTSAAPVTTQTGVTVPIAVAPPPPRFPSPEGPPPPPPPPPPLPPPPPTYPIFVAVAARAASLPAGAVALIAVAAVLLVLLLAFLSLPKDRRLGLLTRLHVLRDKKIVKVQPDYSDEEVQAWQTGTPEPVHARVERPSSRDDVAGRKGRRMFRWWGGSRASTVPAPPVQAGEIGDVEGSTRTPVVSVTGAAGAPPVSPPRSPPRGRFTQTRLRPMQPPSVPDNQAGAGGALQPVQTRISAQPAQTRAFPAGLLPSSWGAFSRPGSRAASRPSSAARGTQYAAANPVRTDSAERSDDIDDTVQAGGVRSPQRPAA